MHKLPSPLFQRVMLSAIID